MEDIDNEGTGSEYLDGYLSLLNKRQEEKESEAPVIEDTDDEDLAILESLDDTYSRVRKHYGENAAKTYASKVYNTNPYEDGKASDYFNVLLNETGDAKIAAAMLGNAIQESNLNPQTVHDNNTGYGLFGHRLDRKNDLINFIQRNKNIPEYQAQLKYAVQELKTNYKSVYDKMLNARTVDEAALAFSDGYERPNAKYANNAQRVFNAKKLYNSYNKRQLGGWSSLMKNIPIIQDINQVKTGFQDLKQQRSSLGVIDNTPMEFPFSRNPNTGNNVNIGSMYKSGIPYSTSSPTKQYSTDNAVPVVDPTTAIISGVDKGLTKLINFGNTINEGYKKYKGIGINAVGMLPELIGAIKEDNYFDKNIYETGYSNLNTNNYYS